MTVPFHKSQTKENLMRAFIGESQARNRYVFAARQAYKESHHMIGDVFYMTAHQEQQHAYIFYNHLQECAGQTIDVEGNYPVNVLQDTIALLKDAHHNEYQEFEDIYPTFAKIAKDEGYLNVAQDFLNIAKIEKSHGDRFKMFAQFLQDGELCQSQDVWICLNCGFIYEGNDAPKQCPVCHYQQDYFVPIDIYPYTQRSN